MTPLLIFIGIVPSVAVATVSSHIAASSMSSALSYWRRNAIDMQLAMMLLGGGIVGTAGGVCDFTLLRSADLLDLVIALSYVVLLVGVGGMMINEAIRAIMRAYQGYPVVLRRPAVTPGCMACPSRSDSSVRKSTSRRSRFSVSA